MNRFDEISKALQAPFEPWQVLTRQENGRDLSYIHPTTAMQRLDDVLGCANWRPTYREVGKGIECTIEVYFEDTGWIAKPDVGGYPGMTKKVTDPETREKHTIADDENDIKGAYSDAFKRAACVWGIGRYLRFKGQPADRTPDRAPNPTPLSNRPANPAPTPAPQEQPRTHVNHKAHDGPPRSGKALFAWTKDQEQHYQVSLLKYLNGWAKLQEFPSRMVEWDGDQVERAYAEACRKLQSISSGQSRAEAYEDAIAN